ncbi:MAG: type II toxin-antitoxin system VapC family toxin [Thermodesulfobacteriota bacterium]|nr:type II toxin-antitoxin system VapC family toxin [Thermodesulfobacteriota bacterium]
MILFFDTSALVKVFHEEKGSEVVTPLIKAKDNEVWISELARIEFLSAIFRRVRNREISDEQLNEAVIGFEEQLYFFNVEPLGQAILREAELLLKKYGKRRRLRSLDALQMGTFSLISERGWYFVAADDILCEIAKDMGFAVINPLQG